MRHQRVERLLPDLASGRLSEEERETLVRHLENCAECAEWLATYRLFSEAFREETHLSSEQLARHAVSSELLTVPERERLTEHLGTCLVCRQDLDVTRDALSAGRESHAGWLETARASLGRHPVRIALAATLVASVALSLLVNRAAVKDEGRDYDLLGDLYNGTQLIETEGSITAQSVTVGSDSDITFSAGESVVLGEGFEVQSGATFSVKIARSPSVGGPLQSAERQSDSS